MRLTSRGKNALSLCLSVMMLLGSLTTLHYCLLPHMLMPSGLASDTNTSDTALPYNELHAPNTTTLFIDYQLGQHSVFQFFTYGCFAKISVNSIPLTRISNGACHDGVDNLHVDLRAYLSAGKNKLAIQSTRGNPVFVGPLLFGPLGWSATNWQLSNLFVLIAVLSTALILVFGMCCLTGKIVPGSILACGMFVFLYQLSCTDFLFKAMDMPGHLDYITYIVNFNTLPNPAAGWQGYQPPLYYFLEALVYKWAVWLESVDVLTSLRVFSVCLFMGFLVFSSLILHRLIANRVAYYTALLLTVFYSGGILISARVDSNILFYFLCSGCLYCLMQWLTTLKQSHLGLALFFWGLAIMTRSNALILLPFICLAPAYLWRAKKLSVAWRSPTFLLGVAVVWGGFLLNVGRTYFYNHTGNTQHSYIVGNVHLLPMGLSIRNEWYKLFELYFPNYFRDPFWASVGYNWDREYFWNAVLKSSLFGEWHWNNGNIAHILSVIQLWLIIYICISIAGYWKTLKKSASFWMLTAILWLPLFALMAFRLLYSYSCSQDFRYIYPAITGFTGLLGIVIERYLESRNYLLAGLGIVATVIFAAYSIIFFVTQ